MRNSERGNSSTVHISHGSPAIESKSRRRQHRMSFLRTGQGHVQSDVLMLFQDMSLPSQSRKTRRQEEESKWTNIATKSRHNRAQSNVTRNMASRATSFVEPISALKEVSGVPRHRHSRHGKLNHHNQDSCRQDAATTATVDADIGHSAQTNDHGNGNENGDQSIVERVGRPESDIEPRGSPMHIRRAPEFRDNRAIRKSLSEWEAMYLLAELHNVDSSSAQEIGDGTVESSDKETQSSSYLDPDIAHAPEGRRRRSNSRDGSFGARRTASFSSFTDCLGL